MQTTEELKGFEDYKHKLRMEELDFERKTANMIHQQRMELFRIANAERRKSIEFDHLCKVEEIKTKDSLIKQKRY